MRTCLTDARCRALGHRSDRFEHLLFGWLMALTYVSLRSSTKETFCASCGVAAVELWIVGADMTYRVWECFACLRQRATPIDRSAQASGFSHLLNECDGRNAGEKASEMKNPEILAPRDMCRSCTQPLHDLMGNCRHNSRSDGFLPQFLVRLKLNPL